MKQRGFENGRSSQHDGFARAPFSGDVRQERGAAAALEVFMMLLQSDTCVSSYIGLNPVRPGR